MSESSIVALAVSIVGVVATGLTAWFTARMALRTDIERATILRFVEMFETTIYSPLERGFVASFKEAQSFLALRREYFIRCYAVWRKKNLSYIKDICPSAHQ